MIKDTIVAKQYQIKERIGKGAFGEIWKAINLVTKSNVAIKFEDITAKHQQLHTECKIYLWFQKSQLAKSQKIPKVFYYGIEQNKNMMVMDILGDSLEKKFKKSGKKMSLKTVLMLADQMISRLGFVHSRFIIHRDIKPDNFAMGSGENSKYVYIIDFGLAKKFMSCSKKEHIKFKENKLLTGTARYASVNTHRGYEQSRRDDLESLGYVFVYLLKGVLPWQNLKAKDLNEKYEKIKEKKMETGVEEVCEGCPAEFSQYLEYVKGLGFEDEPDYNYLRSLFKKLFDDLKYKFDFLYDWSSISGGGVHV